MLRALKDLLNSLTSEVEVRPGMNVFSGRKLVLKVRVWRDKEQRWYDVPDQITTIDGAPR